MEKIKRTKGNLTLEEEIAILLKPTKSAFGQLLIYVEGPTDVKIYREIAFQVASSLQIALSDRGGRKNLFDLFEAVSERAEEINRPLLFFADRDLFVFKPIPQKYRSILFTKGYSIENDLFQDGKLVLDSKLRPDERQRFDLLINSVVDWFAHEINIGLKDQPTDLKINISLRHKLAITKDGEALTPEFLSQHNYVTPPNDLRDQILDNYAQILRGKFLFEIFFIIFHSRVSGDFKPRDEDLWLDCIAEGMRDPDKSTNCNRIALTIKESLQSL